MLVKSHIRSVRGYTLLEIALVLFIILLMMGVAIPATSGLLAEERLRQHADALQLFARTARRLAVSENQAYQIRFAKEGFLLEPYLSERSLHEDVVSSHPLTRDTTYAVERWGGKEFSHPVDESWVFQPDGICEPIRVHFQSGKGWIEFGFNPLTATPQEETYRF